NPFHHSSGVFRHRSVADFRQRWVTVVLSFVAGDDEDRRSPNFVEPVDVRAIRRRILAETLLRFANQVVSLAILRGSGGTDLGTSSWPAFSHPVRTHNAFADSRIQRLPFVFRLPKHASHHAVPASDALPDVVDHRARRGLMEGAYRTHRRASWLFTVHTEPAHEFVILGQNYCVLMCRLHRLRGYVVVVGQLVLLRTRAFALFASDAHGCVI